MKKVALGIVLALSIVGCKAQVHVYAKAPTPPPKQEEPKVEEPAPMAPEPKAGDQIVLPEQIEFELDEARLKQTPKTLDTLQKLSEMMGAHPNITKLRIEGHTDSTGRAKHNDKLSKARAEAVAKWLVLHGTESSRLATVGYGAKRPLAPNDSTDHRAMNRRTEYYVEELDGKKVDAPAEPQKVASGTPTGGKTTR